MYLKMIWMLPFTYGIQTMFPQQGKNIWFLTYGYFQRESLHVLLMIMNSVKKWLFCFPIYRTTVTLLRYTLSVLSADSSVAALSRPSGGVIKEAMKSSPIKYCDCKAYKVRMLWTKDMKEFNSTVIQESVSNAWVAANDGSHCKLLQIILLSIFSISNSLNTFFSYSGFGLIIPTSVINSEAGYVAGSG